MKRYLLTIFTISLVLAMLSGCAGQSVAKDADMETIDMSEIPQQANPPVAEGSQSNNLAEKASSSSYEKLVAQKTKDYQQKSIADFNAAIAPTRDDLGEMLEAQADVTVSPEDENYGFITDTIRFSLTEMYCDVFEEEVGFYGWVTKNTKPSGKMDDGLIVYDFSCYVGFILNYDIHSPEKLTVEKRDAALLTFQAELQGYLDGLDEKEIMEGNFRAMLENKASEIADSLSSAEMELSCEICQIEINDSSSYERETKS